MKIFGRIVVVLLVLGIIVLLAYLVYRFIFPLWAPLLFYSYLLVGIAGSGFGLVKLRLDLKKSRDVREAILASIRHAATRGKGSTLKKARQIVSQFAEFTESVLVWPLEVARGLKQARKYHGAGPRQFVYNLAMTLHDHNRALFSLGMIGTAFILRMIGVRGNGYGIAFMAIMGLSISLRHVRYATETDTLPARLRRLSGRAYLSFLFLIVVDFTSLLLVFTLISIDQWESWPSASDFSTTGQSLFQFRQLIHIFSGQPIPLEQIFSGFAGLLFYLAYIRILLRINEFKQQDADRHLLAVQNNLLGRFSSSLKILDRVGEPTIVTQLNRIVALLGVNQLAKARDQARLLLEQRGETPSHDKVFRVLADCSIGGPMPHDTILALLESAIDDGVSDILVCDCMRVYISVFPTTEVIAAIKQKLHPAVDRYPLSCAILLMHERHIESARSLLDSATPGTELEEASRMILLLTATLIDPDTTEAEDAASLREWLETKLPIVLDLFEAVSDPTELVVAFGDIMNIRALARLLDKSWEERLTYHADQLKKRVAGHPEGEIVVKAIEFRLRRDSSF